jgi:FkbM family methyltransferase
MHKSDLIVGIATTVPPIGKGALWLWAKTRQLLGRNSNGEDHWLAVHVAQLLHYRVPVTTRLGNGMKIKVHAHDYIGGQILRFGYYEKEIVRLFERLLRPGMVFVDVGAHVGQYTLVASQLVGTTGQVHSFEPDPETYNWLESNIRRNRLANVFANRIALTAEPGTMRLYLSNINDIGSNSLQPPPNASGRSCDVTCTPLDNYLKEHNVSHVDLIKMDVEGAESSALAGAASLLSHKDRPPIIIEFEEERQRAFQTSCVQLAALLEGWRYRLFRISGVAITPYTPRNPEQNSFNVLAIPEDRPELIRELQSTG